MVQDTDVTSALFARLDAASLGAMELFCVYVGDRLGYYRSLANEGPASSGELAARTGTTERYAREWLEQQAVTGILRVDAATADPKGRRYELPRGHAEVLTDLDSLEYVPPTAREVVAAGSRLSEVIDAFRSGGGVDWEAYGSDLSEAEADGHRAVYLQRLGRDYLPQIPGLHARLHADPPGRVADVGCGSGWSSIAMARAYPKVVVDGFDLDEPAIESARKNAAETGVGDRVTFACRDAADPELTGPYDLVAAFVCIHDLAQPVEALAAMRRLAAPDGTVLVVDQRVADVFTAPGDEVERAKYAISVLVCLPGGMSQQPSAGTGTVMRTDTLRGYARQAGFVDVEVLPIDHEAWRFYRLVH